MHKIVKLINYLKTIAEIILIRKNRAIIFCVPVHGNIGDQAIILAERKLFNDIDSNRRIIEIESSLTKKICKIIKPFMNKNETIYIHGGGFLGSLWLNEEENARAVIKTFKDNKIIILPQTVFFSDDKEGQRIMNDSKSIYETHSNLHIFVREKYSYDFMKKNFKCNNVYLVPDIVLYLKQRNYKSKREGATICLRSDKEKGIDYLDDVKKALDENNIKIREITDTVIGKNVYKAQRERIVYGKIRSFSEAQIVITDRLHGMVFAYLANTPCLVLKSKSHKVKGVHEWIASKSIVLHDKSIEKEIADLLSKSNESHPIDVKHFNPLIEEIKK